MNTVLEYLNKANPRRILAAIPDIKGLLQEREYKKMEELGGKLGIPIPGMHCRRQIFLDGKQTFDTGIIRSHTVNRNYYNLLFGFANAKDLDDSTFGTGLLSVTDTSGTIRYGDAMAFTYPSQTVSGDGRDATAGILATSGSVANGIVIGTSSAAESFEGYELGAIIANGSASGEMDYSQSELHAITNSTLTLKNTLIRDFNNNSGAGITVEEAGIYVGGRVASATRTLMITRDLTGGDVVADAAQYRYTYESTLVYPS